MNLAKINSEAIEELEVIIDEIFVAKIDSKIDEKLNALSAENVKNSRGINASIRDVSTAFRKNADDIEEIIDGIKSASDTQYELKKITKEGFESIQNKLSEVQDEFLPEILSNATNILDNQKKHSEEFLIKLEGAIVSHTENILANNLENRELFKRSQSELQSDISHIINDNGNNQTKNIRDLGESISDFVELENQNKLNLRKQLESEFQKLERQNSVLIRDIDEKLKNLKVENEKQASEVINKSNFKFTGLLVINVLILILLLLNQFLPFD